MQPELRYLDIHNPSLALQVATLLWIAVPDHALVGRECTSCQGLLDSPMSCPLSLL